MNTKISELLQKIVKSFSLLSFAFYTLGVLVVFIYAISNQIPWSYVSEDTNFIFMGLLVYSIIYVVILVIPILPHYFLISMLKEDYRALLREDFKFYLYFSTVFAFLFTALFVVYTNSTLQSYIVKLLGFESDRLDLLDLIMLALIFILFLCFTLGLLSSIIQALKNKFKFGLLIVSYFISALWVSVNLFVWFNFVWKVSIALLKGSYLEYVFIAIFIFIAFLIYIFSIKELYELFLKKDKKWNLEAIKVIFLIPTSFLLLTMLLFLFGYKDVINIPLRVLRVGGNIPISVMLKNDSVSGEQSKLRQEKDLIKNFEEARLLWISTRTVVVKIKKKNKDLIEVIPRENIDKIIFQSN